MYHRISALLRFDEHALVGRGVHPDAVVPYTAMYNALSVQLTAGLSALACTRYGAYHAVLSNCRYSCSSSSSSSIGLYKDDCDSRMHQRNTAPYPLISPSSSSSSQTYSSFFFLLLLTYHTSFHRSRCLSSSAYAGINMLMLLATPVRAQVSSAQSLASIQPVMARSQTIVSFACCAKIVRSSPALHLQRRHASVSHCSSSFSTSTTSPAALSGSAKEVGSDEIHRSAVRINSDDNKRTCGSNTARGSSAENENDTFRAEIPFTQSHFDNAEGHTRAAKDRVHAHAYEDDANMQPETCSSSSTFPQVVEACCVLQLISDTGVVQSNWTRPDILQRAYHKLVRQHHPDMYGGDNAVMTRINAAYTRLRRLSPYERCAYANELRSRDRRDIVALSLRQCADADGDEAECASHAYGDTCYASNSVSGRPVSRFRYTFYEHNHSTAMSSSTLDMVRLMLGSSCTTLLCAMLWLGWSSVYDYVVGADTHTIKARV